MFEFDSLVYYTVYINFNVNFDTDNLWLCIYSFGGESRGHLRGGGIFSKT